MKKTIFIFLIGLLLLGMFVGTASAMTGSGTSSDPYLINSPDDLNLLDGSGFSSYSGGKYFKLNSNITVSSSFGGIGTSSYPFDGDFNGNNKTLTFTGTNGLFKYVKKHTLRNLNVYSLQNALIMNIPSASVLTISNVKIYNSYRDVTFSSSQTRAGFLFNNGDLGLNSSISGIYIYNSAISCNLGNQQAKIGMLWGYGISYGASISNCYISNCMINHKINGGDYPAFGGMIGYISVYNGRSVTITNCTVDNFYVKSKESNTNKLAIGGILGYASGSSITLRNCSVTNCSLLSATYVGGLLGDTSGSTGATISNCNSVNNLITATRGESGTSTPNAYSGGVVGRLNGANAVVENNTVKNCNIYSSYSGRGVVVGGGSSYTESGNTTSGITNVNTSLTRFVSASLTNNSPQSSPKQINQTVTFTINGLQGAAIYLEDTTIKSGYSFSYGTGGSKVGDNPFTATYTSSGAKTTSVTISSWNGSSTVSVGSLSSTAYIKSSGTLNGSGTQADPYQVGSHSDWNIWATDYFYYDTKYMALTNDFTSTTRVTDFHGNLEGNNHTLINITVPPFISLNGTVKDLKISNSILKGYQGILASASSNANVSNVTIENCFVQHVNAAGIIGTAGTSTFTNCTVNHTTIVATGTGTNGKAGGICYGGNVTLNNCRVLNCDILGVTTYGVCP